MYATPTRPDHGRLIGGVCAALAERWSIDVHLVRVAFASLALASGLGVAIYLGLWLLLPSASGEPSSAWMMLRGNARELGTVSSRSVDRLLAAWARTDAAAAPWPRSRRWIGLGLIVLGGWLVLGSLGLFAWLGLKTTAGVILALIGFALLKSLSPGPAPGEAGAPELRHGAPGRPGPQREAPR